MNYFRTTATGAMALVVVGLGLIEPAPARATPESGQYEVGGIAVQGLPRFRSADALLDYVATHATSTTIDATSGDVLRVEAVPRAERISYRGTCGKGDAYWAAAAVPYTNNCFYGSAGTHSLGASGTRSNKFSMGSYTARGGWISGGKQMYTPKQGPGSVGALNGTVTVNLGQIF